MPELIEVEIYRSAALGLIGATIAEVSAPDPWYLKGGLDRDVVASALVDRRLVGARRLGKLLLLDVDDGTVLGLRFGMTGRLVVDDVAAIDRLLYTSAQDEPRWDRFGLRFTNGRAARVQDPRRLGGVELSPDISRLGPDAATVGAAALRRALAWSHAPLKARLMDQQHLAGLGNLLTDEILWRARLSPLRAAATVDATVAAALARTVRATVVQLSRRGGSHLGDLQPQRRRDGLCPRCGEPLRVTVVGGRRTYWCAQCQH